MNKILEKMRIKTPHTICTLNAPAGFEKSFGKTPGIMVTDDLTSSFDSLHWFISNKAQVDQETPKIMKLLQPGVIVWGYYPKSSSKVQTDLTRDKGWESLLTQPDIKWLSLVSFDDTWSAFAFRLLAEKDKKDHLVLKEREIFKYADPATKTIILPEDLALAFIKNKNAKILFDALSFTNRREYIEWVVTAKREETRSKRILGTIEKLLAGLKNPAGRN